MATIHTFPRQRVSRKRPVLRLKPVDSKGVEAIGYDAGERILDICYPGGATYRYFGVSPQRHQALIAADSIGGYVNEHIKPNYRVEKLN